MKESRSGPGGLPGGGLGDQPAGVTGWVWEKLAG